MSDELKEERFFERLAAFEPTAAGGEVAPSRLKSRIYSALLARQAKTGPLASLTESKAFGDGLCPFEELVRIAPLGERAKHSNPCTVCHARILAERFEHPPIYWPNCPYVRFKTSEEPS
ncbi:MAG: hypothetical protein ACRD9L_10970 [Bryobacteraceae bacterium]